MTALNDLRKSLDAALAAGRAIDIFFRDDDADDDLPNLRRLLDLFLERAAPLNLAVIPGTLTAAGADLLTGRHNQAPQLIELSQHGWMHTNHETAGRKCEFGPSRGYQSQLEDIVRGRDVLDAAFGHAWHKAFTPPWNRCSTHTLHALDELAFTVLSRDASEPAVAAHHFCEIPVTFDVFTWKKGAELKSESQIAASIAIQVQGGRRIGILLHHKVMTQDAFRTVAALLDEFGRSPAAHLHTLRNLAASQRFAEVNSCSA
jgi:hypothetical protein